jgi:hypothetical protein
MTVISSPTSQYSLPLPARQIRGNRDGRVFRAFFRLGFLVNVKKTVREFASDAYAQHALTVIDRVLDEGIFSSGSHTVYGTVIIRTSDNP